MTDESSRQAVLADFESKFAFALTTLLGIGVIGALLSVLGMSEQTLVWVLVSVLIVFLPFAPATHWLSRRRGRSQHVPLSVRKDRRPASAGALADVLAFVMVTVIVLGLHHLLDVLQGQLTASKRLEFLERLTLTTLFLNLLFVFMATTLRVLSRDTRTLQSTVRELTDALAKLRSALPNRRPSPRPEAGALATFFQDVLWVLALAFVSASLTFFGLPLYSTLPLASLCLAVVVVLRVLQPGNAVQ